MKIIGIFFIMSGIFIAMAGCKPKEDLTPVKNEVARLRAEWIVSQDNLTAVMTDLKNASVSVNDGIARLQKISDNGDPRVRQNAENMIIVAEDVRKEIVARMDNLNAVIHEWSDHSKNLNKLIELISSEKITMADATSEVQNLKSFRMDAMPRIQAVRDFLDSREEGIKKIKQFVRKYE